MNKSLQKPYRLVRFKMYFKTDKQISVFEFGQMAGITLDPENRWIKKAHLIDWDMLEEQYSYLFCENNEQSCGLKIALFVI